jgi:hypothetical protein
LAALYRKGNQSREKRSIYLLGKPLGGMDKASSNQSNRHKPPTMLISELKKYQKILDRKE